ncbi:MAG: chitinase [Flavobacteriales bacterium]|nr:chitinase [Flavobacteriales bacterium]
MVLLLAACTTSTAWGQQHDLVGYWHNWNDGNAPYLELAAIDDRYTVIDIAFAEPQPGTSHVMSFAPSGTPQAVFIGQVAALRAQGKKVLISIGGANASVHLDSDQERDEFVISVLEIIGTYGFDGIDIDLEGSSVAITGGSISTPIDASMIRLIDAITSIADAFEAAYSTPMMLTMAPETAYVQGGQSAFGGIWGAYLPLIDALRDRIDILHVQLYNSGSMYGIDGGIYAQGSADFIVSQVDALLQGFGTSGGFFEPLPAAKVAIGLPACPSAAGGGYVSPAVLADAVAYLRGTGPQPGLYQLAGTYPDLRGLMTWSINWDAAPGCAASYEFAESYEDLFDLSTGTDEAVHSDVTLMVENGVLSIQGQYGVHNLSLYDAEGRICAFVAATDGHASWPADLRGGFYWVRVAGAGIAPMRVLAP